MNSKSIVWQKQDEEVARQFLDKWYSQGHVEAAARSRSDAYDGKEMLIPWQYKKVNALP